MRRGHMGIVSLLGVAHGTAAALCRSAEIVSLRTTWRGVRSLRATIAFRFATPLASERFGDKRVAGRAGELAIRAVALRSPRCGAGVAASRSRAIGAGERSDRSH